MDRRTCLKRMAAAAVAAAPVRSRGVAADDPVPPMRFGFSLYGMKSVEPIEALKACAAIGYDGVELALLLDWPTDPRRLGAADRRNIRQQLADSGLALLGLMENLSEPAEASTHQSNLDRLKTAAELGHFLSPNAPPCIETILGGKPPDWDATKVRLADRLRSWAEAAAAAKTVIALKPHVSNALHTPQQAAWLMDQVKSPWLKLAFDYSHFQLRGFPLTGTVEALVPLAAFIHVKDARGTPDRVEFLLPGDGTVDYVDYFRAARKAGYHGPVVVEVSGQLSGRPGYDPIAAARKCYDNLAPAFQESGVRQGR